MNKKLVIGVVVVIVLILAYWLLSPLFVNNVVNEELPSSTGSSGQSTSPDITSTDDSTATTGSEQSSNEIASGQFVDADNFHKTSGTARILEIDNTNYLSLEDFQTTNGPDLYVYLATDETAEDFINLGELKGNIGNQNYEIPEGTDLNKYNKVLIWCRAFGVLFGSAELN